MIHEIEPVFVEQIPGNMEEGKLYISEKYEIAIHLCACGCLGKSVTPLGKDGWVLTKQMDGKVSLTPSIGNWTGECPYHAHYFVTNNKIVWA